MSFTDPYVRLADLEVTVDGMEESVTNALTYLRNIDQQVIPARVVRDINAAIGELEGWVS